MIEISKIVIASILRFILTIQKKTQKGKDEYFIGLSFYVEFIFNMTIYMSCDSRIITTYNRVHDHGYSKLDIH